MKQFVMAAAVAAAGFAVIASPAFAADVGVSVSVGQPGFYGRLDIGDFPQPQVIYRQPVMIQRVEVDRPPVYLRVPPGHAKHWSKHCGEYNACGERVYFVNDNWYNREYVPRYREREQHRGNDRGGNDHGDNDHGDRGNGGQGHGNGDKGRGHGNH